MHTIYHPRNPNRVIATCVSTSTILIHFYLKQQTKKKVLVIKMSSMMNNNNCVLSNCYPPYRTKYDRMMQARGSKFCQPSGMLVCDASGNLVMTNNGSQNVVEGYQRRRQVVRRRRPHPRKEGFQHKKDQKVVFYSMARCPHCVNSKKALAAEIKSGEVVIKDASEASRDGVKAEGFPTFVSKVNKNTIAGAVKSMAQLNKKLDH